MKRAREGAFGSKCFSLSRTNPKSKCEICYITYSVRYLSRYGKAHYVNQIKSTLETSICQCRRPLQKNLKRWEPICRCSCSGRSLELLQHRYLSIRFVDAGYLLNVTDVRAQALNDCAETETVPRTGRRSKYNAARPFVATTR